MAYKVKDVKQGKDSLSGRLPYLEQIKEISVEKKCIKFGPKLTKYLKIQIFETLMQFLCTFRKTWGLRKLKTFKNEQMVVVESSLKR